ncbi:TPA: hypothetical protein ACU8BP_002245 [Neisseria subflava]|jgi:hypothetical protein|uniref:hypothetical protein n=1 Tax=Neisseria TaxID=482 RepID=UPI001F389911|nr:MULTISPECIES: hypothetical protein [Neisseria]DAI06841.1 MAG TPA: hypothetical protein [Inoviridae sp.]
MFTFQLKENFFDLIEEFLNLLNQRDFKQLEIKFQLNKNVYDEILEELDYENISDKKLSLAPKEIALTAQNDNRPIFEIYSMNNTEEIIGVESCLYADTEETDLTLEGSIHKKDDEYIFIYHSIRA